MKNTKTKRGAQLRIIERKNHKAKRGTVSDYASFETFRRELYGCGHEGALVAFSAGRVLRRNWSKAGAKIRVTFGAGKKALDSFIRITRNGKQIYAQSI